MLGRREWCLLVVAVVVASAGTSKVEAETGPLRSKRQVGINFGIPNFNGGGGSGGGGSSGGNDSGGSDRQDGNNRNNNNPFASAIGSILGGFINGQNRPNNNNSGGGNGNHHGNHNRPGNRPNNRPGNRPGNRPDNRPGENVLGNINIGGLPITVTGNQNGFGISFGQGGCGQDNAGCEQNCRVVRRRPRCSCNPGYFLNSDRRSCAEMNECLRNNGGCGDVCVNSPGSYTCSCKSGTLQSDQRTCSSGSQSCNINNGGCSQICSQNHQGVKCFCQQGFSLGRDDTSCLQLDLCLENNGGCEEICTNSFRGQVCTCKPGKVLGRGGRCHDINECQFNNGGCHYRCVNTPGSFKCECPPGYELVNDRFCQQNRPIPPPITTTTTTSTTTTTQRPSTGGTQPTSGCGINPKKSLFNRIVGGKPADPKDWPWMAALFLAASNTQYCGGTLVTNIHILTAAHCLKPFSAKDIRVKLGEYSFKQSSTNSLEFSVVSIRMHERYNSNTQENDIALIKLDRPAIFSEFIWPVCLPEPRTSYTGRNGYVTGWGTIRFGGPVSPVLLEVVVPVWKPDECRSAYPNKIFPGMMCVGSKVGGKDSCQGDSGGPFQVQEFRSRRWYMAGVVSWGEGCGQAQKPGVYTEVALYVDWIKSNVIF